MDRRRYYSELDDSDRWDAVALRPGDIVISAQSKTGTTWTQMICALLVFQTPALPAPLTALSPWVDMRIRPINDVVKQLEAQEHRRFLKTHTALDGLPMHDTVTYIAVARHPLDAGVSKLHQQSNLRYDVIERLVEKADGGVWDDDEEHAEPAPLRDRLLQWINDDSGAEAGFGLAGFVRQARIAWERRAEANVVLLHYADLTRDLEGQMRLLAQRLDIAVVESSWPQLVDAARFTTMKRRSAALVPDERLGILKNTDEFFRSGASEQWGEVLTAEDVDQYRQRVKTMCPPDLLSWLTSGTAS